MARSRTQYRVRWHHPSWTDAAWNQRVFGTLKGALSYAQKMKENGSETSLFTRKCEPWRPLDSTQSEQDSGPFIGQYPNAAWTLRGVIEALELPAGARFPSPRALAAQLGMSRANASDIKREGLADGYLRIGQHHWLTTTESWTHAITRLSPMAPSD